MRVGIDTKAATSQKTGFGVYTKNLVENLFKVSKGIDFVLLGAEQKSDLNTPSRWLWDQLILPLKASLANLDLLHKPCFSPPIFYKGKIIVTIHDLIPMIYPQNFSIPSRLYWTRWLPYSFRKADKVITISKHTKKDLIKYLEIPEEKIKVIYLGPSFAPTFFDKQLRLKIRRKYNLPEQFILTIGTLEPRKNLTFLLEVFWRAKKKFRIKEKLVIAGKIGWGLEDFFRKIKSKNLKKEVVLLSYVIDEDLPALYSEATIFAFPSLYEGFGLPVLDALNMGCPVISSNASSLPEIIGEAGILISPHNVIEWSEAVGSLLVNKRLQFQLKEKGLRQAKKFSWQKCAKETLKVYKEVIEGEI